MSGRSEDRSDETSSAIPYEALRPLVAMPDVRDGAMTFRLGGRSVRVRGDLALCREVVSLCNGHRSVAEIADEFDPPLVARVHSVIRTLLDRGVAVDCTQAYRLFHAQSSAGSAFFRPLSDDDARALRQRTPRPARLLERSELLRPSVTSVGEVIDRRRSTAPGSERRPVDFTEVSTVAAAMYGRTAAGTRAVPSGGALYPLLVHLLVRRSVPPLEPGLWWYDPSDAAFRLCRSNALGLDEVIVPDPFIEVLLARATPIVFVSADLELMAARYANGGYRLALMEAGAAMQNAHLAAAELGVSIRAVAGFFDERTQEFLELAEGCFPLLTMVLGS